MTPGDRIDPYRLIAFLGRGGMGEVFAAVHERMNQPVALKLLTRVEPASPDIRTTAWCTSELLRFRSWFIWAGWWGRCIQSRFGCATVGRSASFHGTMRLLQPRSIPCVDLQLVAPSVDVFSTEAEVMAV